MSKRLDELMAMADGIDRRGECPPHDKLSEAQRSVLARAATLGSAIMQHPVSHAEAMMTLAQALPKNAAPLPAEVLIAEVARQTDALTADLFRLFPSDDL